MSPPIFTYYESILGLMGHGGFSYDLAHHAMHALDGLDYQRQKLERLRANRA